MNHKEIYKLPLSIDKFCKSIVYTSDEERAFDFMDENYQFTDIRKMFIIDMINSKTHDLSIKYKLKYEDTYIHMLYQGEWIKIISIRGWGHLTGIGGLNLPQEQAAKIQDEFGLFILNKIKSK